MKVGTGNMACRVEIASEDGACAFAVLQTSASHVLEHMLLSACLLPMQRSLANSNGRFRFGLVVKHVV